MVAVGNSVSKYGDQFSARITQFFTCVYEMKASSTTRSGSTGLRRGSVGGVLLAVIAVIVIVVSFTHGGFIVCEQSAERNKTTASMAAIRSGLEQYKEKYGHYPVPNSEADNDSGTFGGIEMNRGRASMLYQAITGDGNNLIDQQGVDSSNSDGAVREDELARSVNNRLPPQMIFSAGRKPGEAGQRLFIDGYGRPFQYTVGGSANAVNSTYDLWSYGDVEPGPVSEDLETKKSPTKSVTWIKNW